VRLQNGIEDIESVSLKQLARVRVFQPKSSLHVLSLLTSLQLRPIGTGRVLVLSSLVSLSFSSVRSVCSWPENCDD
jgi:hypothetical protein